VAQSALSRIRVSLSHSSPSLVTAAAPTCGCSGEVGVVTVQILAKCRDGGGVLAVVAAPLLLLLRSAPIWLRHGGSKMEAALLVVVMRVAV